MRSQGLWHATALDHRTGSLVLVRHRPRLLLPWLMRHHAPAVCRPVQSPACCRCSCALLAVPWHKLIVGEMLLQAALVAASSSWHG